MYYGCINFTLISTSSLLGYGFVCVIVIVIGIRFLCGYKYRRDLHFCQNKYWWTRKKSQHI